MNKTSTLRLLLSLLLFSTTSVSPSLFAQGTAFTYQGQLTINVAPANGTYNLAFTLFTAARRNSDSVRPDAQHAN